MPAAAVIPAPIAYIKVAAVEKLVVGFQFVPNIYFKENDLDQSNFDNRDVLDCTFAILETFTLRKLECFK